MKLSKLFHTLYATVMALPVLIIPIFAININQKSVEPIQIEVQEKISVDFNQYFNNEGGVFNSNAPYGNFLTIRVQREQEHYYVVRLNAIGDFTRMHINVFNYVNTNNPQILQNNFTGHLSYKFFATNGIKQMDFFAEPYSTSIPIDTNGLQLYDLTQMFGSGNEPTIEEFDSLFPQDNYDYSESQKMLVNKPTTTIYNDTDIGSQFLYSLYIPVKKYFNFGNFFGLNGMYDWFALNIFNGTAPLSFFIVFNVMIYWLFISLFWLIFDILIYVPMVIHKWLDKAEM